MTNPPKEKDTLKEAANELEEIVAEHRRFVIDAYVDPMLDEKFSDANTIADLEALIESEKVKARTDELYGVLGALQEATEYDAHATTDSTFEYVDDRIKELESKEEA